MSKFEFTVTIVSIVIAFGLSELMAGWGRILRHRPRPDIDWLFGGWSAGLLLLAVLHWSGLWLYADVQFVALWQLSALLAPPLVLVATVFLFSPDPDSAEELDLRAYFKDVSRPALLLIAAFTLLSLVADVLVAGSAELVFVTLGLGYAVLLVIASLSGRHSLHVAALAAHWVIFLPMAAGLLRTPGW